MKLLIEMNLDNETFQNEDFLENIENAISYALGICRYEIQDEVETENAIFDSNGNTVGKLKIEIE